MFKWIGVSVLILFVVVACLACSTAVADDTETDGAYHVTCYIETARVLDRYFVSIDWDNNDRVVFRNEEKLLYGFAHNASCVGLWESGVNVKKIVGHPKWQSKRREKHQEVSSVY